MTRQALADYPVQPVITDRWSPYAFSDRPVSATELRSLFEAARWSSSSFNEQPWRYIVALRSETAEFEKILGSINPKNREWARHAGALALGLTKRTFSHNGSPNRSAHHDLGAASAGLTLEATARGLAVHQMAGILPDVARESFDVPEDFDVWTALAIGYPAEDGERAAELVARDRKTPTRKPQEEWVFQGGFGEPWKA